MLTGPGQQGVDHVTTLPVTASKFQDHVRELHSQPQCFLKYLRAASMVDSELAPAAM